MTKPATQNARAMETVYAMRVDYGDGSVDYLNVQPVPFSDDMLRRTRERLDQPGKGSVVALYEVEFAADRREP